MIAVLNGATDLIDVREIDMGIDSVAKQIKTKSYQADIAGALTVSEESSFNAICSSQVCKFCSCNSGPAIIVWVQ